MDESPMQPLEPVVKRTRWHLTAAWLVPILCGVIGLSLIVRHISSEGPAIQIFFETAEGLEVGKTLVKYKDVPIGVVSEIANDDDLTHVVVSVDLRRSARRFARADTRFWVVRPRVGTGGITGIGTLRSGEYIAADPGSSQTKATTFTGLESPPAITTASHGTEFSLHSAELGSLEVGSPVYYRRLRVGKVVSYHLDPNGQGVTIGIFVDAPNDRFVLASSRFWNASGIDVSLGADGLKLSTQSLASVAAGGVAFFTPSWAAADAGTAPSGARFELIKDERTALERPGGEPQFIWMIFGKSLRGLSIGAPVEFVGVEIGKVTEVTIGYDAATHLFPIIVGAVIFPERLGRAFENPTPTNPEEQSRHLGLVLGQLIERGLRAQARSANPLTGQLYISIDFVRHATKVAFDGAKRPLQIPTATGTLDNVQEQLSSILTKVDALPFNSLGRNLDQSLSGLTSTLNTLNTEILPEAGRTMLDARKTLGSATETLSGDPPMRQNINETLEELQRSARSVRALTDYLSRHPESLVRGKQRDARPPPAPPVPP